jgi:hypothetical protein
MGWLVFFRCKIEEENFVYVEPFKNSPTLRNNRSSEAQALKRLDRFLVTKNLMSELNRVRSWVKFRGGLDHLSILIQLEKQDLKPASPLKFNPVWLEDEDCLKLVKDEWVGYDKTSRDLASYQFAVALKRRRKQS